jgi:O-antigen ligase
MRILLTPLLFLQRFFVPLMLILLVWAIWRTIFKKDIAVGLALYATLVVLVDGFYNTGLFIPGLQQGSIRYSEICALFVFFNRPPAPPKILRQRAIITLIGLYFFLMLVAALRANSLLTSIFDFRRIIVPQILAIALSIRGFGTFADYRKFFLCTGVLTLIISLFSFWDVFFDQWLLHSDMLLKPEYYMNRKQQRFGSILLNPNFLGAFVVLFFPPLFMLILHESVLRVRIYLAVALLGLLFCLVETQSRAPLLAFGCSIVMLVLGPAGKISRARRVAGLLATLLALTIFMPGFFDRATTRFDSLNRETTTEEVSRASVWQYTSQLIAAHPLLGVGFGETQFLLAMDATDFSNRYGSQSLDNPHNSYLQAAVYAGLPALVIFALANLLLIGKSLSRSTRRSTPPAEYSVIFGLTMGIGAFLLSIYPDMHLFTQNIAPLYWLFFGLLISLVSRSAAPPAPPAMQPAGTRFAGRRQRVTPRTTPNRSINGAGH